MKKESENITLGIYGAVISLVGTLVLYFTIPFCLGLLSDKPLIVEDLIKNKTLLLNENKVLFMIVAMLIPACESFVVFRNFNIRRKKQFIKKLAVALMFTFIPYIIIFIITAVNFREFDIVSFFLKCLVLEFFILSVCIMVAVSVKTIVIQGIYAIAILFLPLVIKGVVLHFYNIFFKSLVVKLDVYEKIFKNYPVMAILSDNFNMDIPGMIFLFILSLFIFLCSYNIFISAPNKNSGYIKYDKLKEIYRFIFFLFFSGISIISAKASLTVLTVCLIVNIILCELIVNGRFKILKEHKLYFVISFVIFIAFFILKFDVLNINNPKIYPDQVDSLYMGTDYDNIINLLEKCENEIVYDFKNINLRKFIKLDADKINRFINFKDTLVNEDGDKPYVYMGYKLNNKKIIIRRYHFNML